MAKLKGLGGRGLDALLGTVETGENDSLKTVPVQSLQPGSYQPRHPIAPESLDELALSIREQGVLQPILVRPKGFDRYEIIAGERRWRAAQQAGLLEVPVLVREVNDPTVAIMALMENLQRENLNPLEEAQAFARLTQEFGLTHEALADRLGRSRSSVSNQLRLLQLAPEVQTLMQQRALDMGHARALLSLPAPQQIKLAHKASQQGWSVRQVEEHVRQLLQAPTAPTPDPAHQAMQQLAQKWSTQLGTTVRIQTRAQGKLQLSIDLDDLQTLERLLAQWPQAAD